MKKFEDIVTEKIKDFIIFLDIDGTLVAHDEVTCSSEVAKKVAALKEHNKLYVCSNNRNIDRNQKIAGNLDLSVINKRYRKPSKKILEFLREEEKNVPFLVIGDKFYPDSTFAKRIGAKFVKVERIVSGRENFVIRFLYLADDLLDKFLANNRNLLT